MPALFDAYQETISPEDKGNQEAFDQLKLLYNDLLIEQVIKPSTEAGRTNQSQLAQDIMDMAAEQVEEMNDFLIEIVQYNADLAAYSVYENQVLSKTMTLVMIVVLVGAALAAMGLGIYISGRISKPTKALSDMMNNLVKTGDFHLNADEVAKVTEFGRCKDETGVTANAETAGKARDLAESIKASAEQGSRQMEQMMSAVAEINESGKAIGKVIKIIDDIAFQTNILALNAAVEAARAGQHGKGFAVVADEVRNLAAKSAEAAKNTSGLIETSIQKAEQGASISAETAESLKQIVEGILQSSELVSGIATSSDEQSLAIGQIGSAIDQVSQVVSQNSATAEESASASQEMSSQATLLQQLIAQFKIKDGVGYRSVMPAPQPQAMQLPAPSGFEGSKY